MPATSPHAIRHPHAPASRDLDADALHRSIGHDFGRPRGVASITRVSTAPGTASVLRSASISLGVGLPGPHQRTPEQAPRCINATHYSAPECRANNDQFHGTAAGGRALVVVAVGAAATAATVADLTPAETALTTLSSSMAAGMAFNLGHNLQQGKPYWYYGEVAATDKWARSIGPQATFWASAAVTSAAIALTVRLLK